ncbi:nucleotidyltransferase family protein [Polluticoccus soli]|uniref:nucleotidyltransferase family protein n=1 Tax=Polluticoccus soli TaxID=3034150 RepID=UPI0023E23AB5|nr:nucleotidyltransferase family protein [Flavipsychrobacter sp. JY13-12]
MECIVLAGGLGTRLRNTIGDYPKCMAEVNGKPFLRYILDYLTLQNCTRLILSLGYKHEVINEWLKSQQYSFEIVPVIENEPLGTGGGIQLALKAAADDNVAVLNGDTMFNVEIVQQLELHKKLGAETTLALKPMSDAGRYGLVNCDDNNIITSFEEKRAGAQGLINGGVYIINRKAFLEHRLPEKFSFETDYLAKFVSEGKFSGFISDSYFIDIGIPEDYNRAQIDFKEKTL